MPTASVCDLVQAAEYLKDRTRLRVVSKIVRTREDDCKAWRCSLQQAIEASLVIVHVLQHGGGGPTGKAEVADERRRGAYRSLENGREWVKRI